MASQQLATSRQPVGSARRAAHYSAAAVSGVVAALYGVFSVLVHDAEQVAESGSDGTFQMYLVLAVV